MRTAALELRRHSVSLTPEEADEVAGLVADLIVGFLKVRQGGQVPIGGGAFQAQRAEEAPPALPAQGVGT